MADPLGLKRRQKKMDAQMDDGTQISQKQEQGEDYSAKIHSKPDTVKVFSDGSTRHWDDVQQAWVKK